MMRLRFLSLIVLALLAGGRVAASREARATASSLAGARPVTPGLDRPWEDEIFYALDLAKFFNGDPANDVMARAYGGERDRLEGGYWGGDLAGVMKKLDYLCDLGVTTLFLSPVIQNDRVPFGKYLATGFRPMDCFAVDENLGRMEDLKRLVAGAHARGLRVILDMPLALPGIQHPLYTAENVAKGWFGRMSAFGVPSWNPEVREVADYLIRVSRFWREETKVDGFRVDSAKMLPETFWRRYAREVRGDSSPRQFFLMAEMVDHPSSIGAMIRETGFNSAYDFSFLVVQNVLGKGGPVGLLSFVLGGAERNYPNPKTMCAEVDNYGDSFLKACLEPKPERLKLALALLLTINRIPLLYSGDEMGSWCQEREVGGLFQPGHRDPAFLAYVKRLIALRKEQEALRRGDFLEAYNVNPLYAFLRIRGRTRILVALNNSGETARLSFPLQETPWPKLALYDLLEKRVRKARGSAEPLALPPFGFAVLRVEGAGR